MNIPAVRRIRISRNARQSCVQGFTFIELLVVLSLMLVIVAFTTTAMRGLAVRQQFQAEVHDVARSISEQRTNAIAALLNQPYGVRITPTEIAYFASTTPDFDPTQTSSTSLMHTVATYTLSDGSDQLFFSRITGVPSATGTIALYSAAADATSTITIYGSGSITQE